MKLTRLRVAGLRRFREPFELTDLQQGLNILAGPNEVGKSTLVRAIRAAFFERHKSTSVGDLQPYGDSSATPLVEIDFEIRGTAYRLSKSFLQKKRCDLVAGVQRLEGVEAEDALAELLGFQFALKGASREEHWGIPGLLWIEQGSAQTVRDSVMHAVVHLRKALDESMSEVSSSAGDDVVRQVRSWRDELLTSTGKPRGPLADALSAAADTDRQIAEFQKAVATYRAQVDQLKSLREAYTEDATSRPWETLRSQQNDAQSALDAITALQGEFNRLNDRLRQTTGLRALLSQGLEAAESQQRSLSARNDALTEATARHEQAVAAEAYASTAETTAAGRLRDARETLSLAKQESTRHTLGQQLADTRARVTELESLLKRAVAEHERAVNLKREAVQHQLNAQDLAALRDQQARLNELQIREAAIATRLRFDLETNAAVWLGGEAINENVERLLVEPTVLTLPGVGRVHIAPGGSDLNELTQAQAQLRDEHKSLLQRLGLASLAEAETRNVMQAQRLAEADAAEKGFKLLAPNGLDALQTEFEAAKARQLEAVSALAQLPPPTLGALILPLMAAEQAHDTAQQVADDAKRALQTARENLATCASQLDAARHERDTLQAVLEDPQRTAELAAKRVQLVEAGAQEHALMSEMAAIEEKIAAARPEILKQDVERFRRSAEELEHQHRARDRQIAQLEATLAVSNAQGLEEDLAHAQSANAFAQRRAAELRRRADALDHLLQKLEARRQALTRRLQGPLQKHLDHYLKLLFSSGRLSVDESLVPGTLTRANQGKSETESFENLSFGSREQMGVISRLAYADLLQEAGRPTLIILDDALVHSDNHRMSQMKRVIFDAAQRHQVLLFTCHAENWRDMGVPVRHLDGVLRQ